MNKMYNISISTVRSSTLTMLAVTILFLININGVSQVTFTQTLNADFQLGYQDNVMISGNNVYLPLLGTDVNNWLTTTDLPKPLINHQLATWNNYVYLTGGYDGINTSNAVYRATIQAAGHGAWTTYDTLPEAIQDHAMVAGLNYLYIIGGKIGGIPSDKIYFAKINSDGTPGEWTLSEVTLPQSLWGHTAAFQNGYLYTVGGTNLESENTAVNVVFYAKKIGIEGKLSSFASTSQLPDARNAHTMVCYDNKLIVLGGTDNLGVKQSTVYYADLSLDGTCSAWQSLADFSIAISNHSGTSHNGLVSVIGGETSDGLSDKVYYATLDDLPSLTWNLATDTLYEARKNGAAYAYNGQLIFAGGENISTSPIHNTRYATLALGSEKIHRGSFMSYPFLQLGEERDIVSLSYNITYNNTFNNYDLLYRLAGSDQVWGNWAEMGQDNPTLIGQHMQYVQYLVKFDGSEDDNIVLHDLTVNISGYTQLTGNLNGMDTLKLENSPFWVTGNISFTGGTHYIEPGVTLLFSPNTSLEIGQANMTFGGTQENPILLTSYSTENGLWNGVYFNTNSDNGVSSQLINVTIENAGNGSWNSNLYCNSTNEPLIQNCTFQNAVGDGIRLVGSDLSIDGSIITSNTENGIYVQTSNPSLSSTDISSNSNAGVYQNDIISIPNYFNCTLEGNYYGIFYPTPNYSFPVVEGITSYNNIISGIAIGAGVISSDQTWPFNPLGYSVLGNVIIAKHNSHARLTISPGNTIHFDTLVQLQIGNYIHYNQHYGGEIFAIGTPDSLITFTSLNGQAGGWEGIYFHYNSDNFSSVSELKNCEITNGNSYNIRCDQTLQPRIDNCIITNSSKHDTYIQDPNSVPHITSSTTTVYIDGGTQNLDKIWYNFGGGDYIILNDIIVAKQNDKARLTIQPGITVQSDTAAMLQVGNYVHYNKHYGGELFAEGTTDSLITFTSLNGAIGGWNGIFFHYNSDEFGSVSSLSFCDIKNGESYNVFCDNTVEPRIDNCTINNSDGYDIWAQEPNSVPHVSNTNSTIYVGPGTQNINKTWYNFGGDYIVIGNVIVAKQNDYCTLTIEPGNTIKLDTAITLQIGKYVHYNQNFGGEIVAEGTHDSIIFFKTLENTQGSWNGIYFHSNADNYGGNSSFEYCIVDGATTNNLYCNETNAIDFEHVTFINSSENGIYLENSSPYIKLCQVINNDSTGIKLSGNSNPVIGDTLGLGCDIYGNGNYNLYNSTGNLVFAKNNYWNTTDSTEIADQIFDFYNDPGYGIVEFMPAATTSYFDNQPPDKFNLISIPDYSATPDQTPSFTWEIPTDPNEDPISYYFYYTDDSTWNSNGVVSQQLSSPNYTIPQTLTGGRWYWWKVTATDGSLVRTSNQTWRFAVSLPPTIPNCIIPTNGSMIHDNDYLTWELSSDPDEGDNVNHYRIQLDDDADFSSPEVDMTNIDADTKSPTLSLKINELDDYLNLENNIYHWRVSATDGFGIESDFSDGSNWFQYQLEVYLSVNLEGPFSGSGMSTTLNNQGLLPLLQPYMIAPWNYSEYVGVSEIPNDQVVDWILIQLRSTSGGPNTATKATTIFTKAAFVLSDGSVVDLDGVSPLQFPISFGDNLYVVIHHRNHLSIMSSSRLSPVTGLYEYDFTTGASKVYGGSAGYKILGNGAWGMAGGNTDAIAIINENDINDEWGNEAGKTGYLQSDLNFDLQSDNKDKNEVLVPNLGKESQVPE